MFKSITVTIRPDGRFDLRPSIPGSCYDVSGVTAERLGAEIAALATAGWTTVATLRKRERIASTGADVSQIMVRAAIAERCSSAALVAALTEAAPAGGRWGDPRAEEARWITRELGITWEFSSWPATLVAARRGRLGGWDLTGPEPVYVERAIG